MFNNVTLVGNLTRNPELRFTPNGTAVTDLGVAVNYKFGDTKETTFLDVTVWGKMAENCCEYLNKGRQILVSGRLKEDTWMDSDNNKRSKIKVVADQVKFLGKKNETNTEIQSQEQEDAIS